MTENPPEGFGPGGGGPGAAGVTGLRRFVKRPSGAPAPGTQAPGTRAPGTQARSPQVPGGLPVQLGGQRQEQIEVSPEAVGEPAQALPCALGLGLVVSYSMQCRGLIDPVEWRHQKQAAIGIDPRQDVQCLPGTVDEQGAAGGEGVPLD